MCKLKYKKKMITLNISTVANRINRFNVRFNEHNSKKNLWKSQQTPYAERF